MTAPLFDAAEFERERRLALDDLDAEQDDYAGRALAAATAALYRAHCFRHRRRGTQASLERLTPQRLRALWEHRYRSADAVLGLSGDVDVDAAISLVQSLGFADDSTRADPIEHVAPRYPSKLRRRRLSFGRDLAHVVLAFGGLTIDDPRAEALDVLTTILGGQSGRLFDALREREGLAYDVSVASCEGVDAGDVTIYVATGQRPRALEVIGRELEQLRRDGVRRDEVERAKAWLVGRFHTEAQRRSRVASALALDEVYGMGAAHYLGIPRRVAKVRARDVMHLVEAVLDPQRCVTVVAD